MVPVIPLTRERRDRTSGWIRTMTRDPNIPAEFDVYTLVLLRRGPKADDFSDVELEALQAQHLAYRADLHRQGRLVVNGPLAEQSDSSLRGVSIFACGLEEAARLNDADPSVAAGRLASDVIGGGGAFGLARVAH